MKYYEDFNRSGESFAERVGAPREFDAAVGKVAMAFAHLEDVARNLIILLSRVDDTCGSILTAELGFRQKLDILGSLLRSNLEPRGQSASEAGAQVGELLVLCSRCNDLRNTYLHSSYGPNLRVKTSAKAGRGLRRTVEPVDAALLLDVSDFIAHMAHELECVPLLLGLADRAQFAAAATHYFHGDELVAAFNIGGMKGDQ